MTYHLELDGSGEIAHEQLVEVDRGEERVLFHGLGFDARCDIFCEHSLKQVSSRWGNRLAPEAQWVVEDHLVENLAVVVVPGWLVEVQKPYFAHEHLIQENAKRPPIHGLPVAVVHDDLRSQVFRRPAECRRPAFFALSRRRGRTLLRQPEVCQLNMAVDLKKDVFGFEVAVQDPPGVQEVQRQIHLCCVETSAVFTEFALTVQMAKELTSLHEVKDLPKSAYVCTMYKFAFV